MDIFKVKKPHDKYIKELCTHETVTVRNTGSGLYFRGRFRHLIGVRPIKQDTWLLYKTNPIHLDMEGRKYTYFIRA